MNEMNLLITDFIKNYMASHENNTMKEINEFAFGEPLVGFSNADDELYPLYKQHIDPDFYRLPEDWLKAAAGRDFDPGEVSIVSWILPQTEATKAKCRVKKACTSYEWQMVRVHGEECNRALAKALENYLNGLGYAAVAPMCSEQFSWGESERFSVISNWSERHTAYIAGLGTFGLCDGLITPLGKAVRIGSVIVNCRLDKTNRPYNSYNEYCQAKNGCIACIKRCPAEAITTDGHDKPKCRLYHSEVIARVCSEEYGYNGYSVCGLCQTGVPCESGIPYDKKY